MKKNFFLVKSILIDDNPKKKKETNKLIYKTITKRKTVIRKDSAGRKRKKVIITKKKVLQEHQKTELKYGSSFLVKERVFQDETTAEKFIKNELKKFKKSKSKSRKLVGSVQIGLGKAKVSKDGFKFEGEVSRSGRLNSIYTNTNILTAKNNITSMFDDAQQSFEEYTVSLVKVKSRKKLKNGKMYYWKRLVKNNDNKRIKISQVKTTSTAFSKQYAKKKGRS